MWSMEENFNQIYVQWVVISVCYKSKHALCPLREAFGARGVTYSFKDFGVELLYFIKQ